MAKSKSNTKTQKENALGTIGDTSKQPAPDKGYSGSDDNQGGNFTDRQADELARQQAEQNNERPSE